MNKEQEKKNQLLGVLTSLTIHLALIALFIFVMGFTAPNPPLSELGSGVELQLGVDDAGSGDVQQPVAIRPTAETAEAIPEEVKKEETVTEHRPQPVEQTKSEPEKPKEELSSDEESPVAAKEVKKEEKKEKKIVPPKEKPVEKKSVTPLAEYKAPDEKAATKQPLTSGTKTDGTDKAKNSKGVSQGDDKGKTGEKGKPDGVADLNGQYTGNKGTGGAGSGGGGISMSGFDGFQKPKIMLPEVPDDSYGVYEFRVKVNSDGDIVQIIPQNRGLSLEAENIFKKLIEKTEFIPNGNVTNTSDGIIKFTIVAGKKP